MESHLASKMLSGPFVGGDQEMGFDFKLQEFLVKYANFSLD